MKTNVTVLVLSRCFPTSLFAVFIFFFLWYWCIKYSFYIDCFTTRFVNYKSVQRKEAFRENKLQCQKFTAMEKKKHTGTRKSLKENGANPIMQFLLFVMTISNGR